MTSSAQGGGGQRELSPSSASLRYLVASAGLATATDDWILDYARLSLGEMVGVGATAAVFRATYSGATVAAKRIPVYDWRSANKAQLRREASLLARLHHPNIVRFYGVILHAQHVYVVTEFVDATLASRMRAEVQRAASVCDDAVSTTAAGHDDDDDDMDPEAARRRRPSHRSRRRRAPPRLPAREFFDVTLGVACALEFLHSRRYAHRDVKPSNVLVDAEGRLAKLCDFGLSKKQTGSAALVTHTTGVGTPAYMSPEVITGRDLADDAPVDDEHPDPVLAADDDGPRAHAGTRRRAPGATPDFAAPTDVFSFGMLLHSAWTCRLPFEEEDEDDAAARSERDDGDDGRAESSLGPRTPLAHASLAPFTVMSKIAAGERPALPADVPPGLASLIARCWAHAPAARPTMARVVADLKAALTAAASEQEEEHKAARRRPGRSWTPASALGEELVLRQLSHRRRPHALSLSPPPTTSRTLLARSAWPSPQRPLNLESSSAGAATRSAPGGVALTASRSASRLSDLLSVTTKKKGGGAPGERRPRGGLRTKTTTTHTVE